MRGSGRRLLAGAAIGLTVAAVVAGVAFATGAVSLADTTIHACAAKNGALSVTTVAAGCKATDTALEWNTQGPPGPQGPAGPAGPSGTTTSAIQNVSVAPGASATLLKVAGKFSLTLNDCAEIPWSPGSYGTHLIFTALSGDELFVDGHPMTQDGTPSFVPLMSEGSGGGGLAITDWTTRETWVVNVLAGQHSGSPDSGNLQCNFGEFVQSTTP